MEYTFRYEKQWHADKQKQCNKIGKEVTSTTKQVKPGKEIENEGG